MQSGLTEKTVERLLLDAGAIYRNWDPENPDATDPIGATRGGSTFSVEKEDREIEVDGVRGPTMGMKRTIRHVASLETTLMEFTEQLFVDLSQGTAAPHSNSDFIEITPSNNITLDSYVENLTLVADIMNQDEPVAIMLKNALIEGEWDVETNDEDEGLISVRFMSHYDAADVANVPYRILIPSAIETT